MEGRRRACVDIQVSVLLSSFSDAKANRRNSFKILIMSDDCGLIETIQDAISIHSIKKQGYKRLPQDRTAYSLHDYFLEEFREDPAKLESARECFMSSLAGYSIVCYLLQIKDRYGFVRVVVVIEVAQV